MTDPTLFPDPAGAVRAWSVRIHGLGSARHRWVLAAAEAILAGQEPPAMPGRPQAGVEADRLGVIRRLLG